ncbi:phospholipid hydroperoxide glutathione peroxidase-like isoform X2 [Phymastichus coffea]|uniref:phospholipid hydroperoxide glutathione peroxidase-like isoform X2 n=1 Tax=Phymastichus coffea TaxID=108790 RepID=UPI00273C94C9|nr:phospholipid hydroperoxide glutathione peroxidase-like isoform X2 [Phymastichus coffea]
MICILYVLHLMLIVSAYGSFDQDVNWSSATSFHDFHARDLYGNNVSLEKYRGQVVIVFSGATRCPVSAKNFKQLQALYDKYNTDGLRIVTFIVDGLAKNSGTATEIQEYIKSINTPFDVYEKIVYDGDNAHPLYKWIKLQLPNQEKIQVSSKILIDKDGKVVDKYPATGPSDLEGAIKQYL